LYPTAQDNSVDRFSSRKRFWNNLTRLLKNSIIHQKDKALGTALKDVGYSELLWMKMILFAEENQKV
jgi:hypothetical protein